MALCTMCGDMYVARRRQRYIDTTPVLGDVDMYKDLPGYPQNLVLRAYCWLTAPIVRSSILPDSHSPYACTVLRSHGDAGPSIVQGHYKCVYMFLRQVVLVLVHPQSYEPKQWITLHALELTM